MIHVFKKSSNQNQKKSNNAFLKKGKKITKNVSQERFLGFTLFPTKNALGRGIHHFLHGAVSYFCEKEKETNIISFRKKVPFLIDLNINKEKNSAAVD